MAAVILFRSFLCLSQLRIDTDTQGYFGGKVTFTWELKAGRVRSKTLLFGVIREAN